MAQPGRVGSVMGGGDGGSYGGGDGGRERGTRRRKVYGYLKAANELRQTYSSQWGKNQDNDLDNEGVPGAFPDVEIARSGLEEMVLFPSYARRHVKRDMEAERQRVRTEADNSDPSSADESSLSGTLDRYKDDNAIVDVDVRGWIYAPHRGQMTRKHRLVVALARRLSGISAPSSSPDSDSSRDTIQGDRRQGRTARHDEDLVRKEAQSIINRGEGEASAAWKGSYSQEPRDSSRASQTRPTSRGPGLETTSSDIDDRQGSETPSRWTTGQQPVMSREELTAANAHLMSRLRPFLADPRVSTPITVFFFNEKNSQSRTVSTNEAGHFSIRVPLEFVPTHVRVLASETLSAVDEVRIIEPRGVSMISDIDDTIKHSAIASGAKEIFRNTFVRELGDLRVLGVEEWYSKLDNMGVQVHYVSNSPWQLYPLLKSYFNLVGLPPGSFHLKQYTGMFQGIFEPAAEKKKGSLERIMRDFPERKFILVGDSGEADLEVYTDVVLANPGRVLGVFIRDVTTTEHKKFFDSSSGHFDKMPPGGTDDLADNVSDKADKRPALPPRKPVNQAQADENKTDSNDVDLIDLHDEDQQPKQETETVRPSATSRALPTKPSKPSALRTNSSDTTINNTSKIEGEEKTSSPITEALSKKPVPPRPAKPRRLSSTKEDIPREMPPPLPSSSSVHPELRRRPVPNPDASNQRPPTGRDRQDGPGDDDSYRTAMKNRVVDVYNNLPSAREYWNGSQDTTESKPSPSSTANLPQAGRSKQPPPIPPPRRSGTTSSIASTASKQSYKAAAAGVVAQYASDHLPWSSSASPTSSPSLRPTNPSSSTPSLLGPSTQGRPNANTSSNYDSSYNSGSTSNPVPTPNKREEVWNRRWARAEEIMEREGVVLRSWRVGEDAQDVCVWLVEQARKEMRRDGDWDEKG